MIQDGHLVLVTHLVPAPSVVERTPALFWRAPDGTWKSTSEARGGLIGLRELVDAYHKRSIELEAQVDHARRASDYFAVLQGVGPVLRAARHLHRALQEAREGIPDDKDIISLRDAAGEVERTCEIVQADAKSGLDYTAARRAEELSETSDRIARSSYRLNLIAALFLPISALGSVFGVNLTHGLEGVAAPFLFWAFVVGAFIVGFIVRAAVKEPELAPRQP
jgi:Mg2+ and Co2+ transporter CorA